MFAHENLFEIRNLCWNHTKLKSNELPFFNDINLVIPANRIISLHGESGCGKTTLLQLLGCLWENKSISGSIKYYGEKEINFGKISKPTILSLRSYDFGFILQNNFFIPHFNSYWNIGLPLLLKGVNEKVAMEQAKVSVNRYFPALSEDAKKISSELSQGMRQRFSCLRGIITNPRVLFADEPISNLDDHNSKALFASLKDWHDSQKNNKNPCSMLIVNHHKLDMLWSDLKPDYYIYMKKNICNQKNHQSHTITILDGSKYQNPKGLVELEKKFSSLKEG